MPRAKIIREQGGPALYIDGVKTPPVLYGLSDFPAARSNTAQAQSNIANFAREGINLVTADTCLHLGWHKSTAFEIEPMQAEIAGVLDANPGAGIFLRLHVNPPYWWLRDNPDELIVYRTADGTDIPGTDDGEPHRLIRGDSDQMMRVSLASRKWLDEAGAHLRLFLQGIRDTREGDALIGIQIACGIYGEWHQWGTDCSTPMQERFRRLLREKYGTREALCAAWGDDSVTFDSARFRPEIHRPGDDGIFRHPVTARDTMDSQQCIQLTPPEAILHFCRIAKANFPKLLTGAFYGYFLGTGGDKAVISGHLAIDMLFNERESIDILCGPFCYLANRSANNVPMQRALLESHRLRGFLWLTEMDQFPVGIEEYPGGDPAHSDETISQLRRNIFQPLLAGMGCWYYDHRIVPSQARPDNSNSPASSIYRKNGWWDTPQLMGEIGAMQRLTRERLLESYSPAADVLIVYDTQSYYIRSKMTDDEYALHDAIGRSGASYDCIYLNELPLAEMERYRCVIFANAYLLSNAQREEIARITRGKHVVWLYAPGYCDGTTLSTENIYATTGMAVERITPESSCHSADGLFPQSYSHSAKGAMTPCFAIADNDARPLAFYDDSGKCAAASKGNVWYFAHPLFSPAMARHIFAEANVHLYCDALDPVIAGSDLLLLNSVAGGERTLHLLSGKRVSHTLKPKTTAIFDANSGERIHF